jgi:hypothetical protein
MKCDAKKLAFWQDHLRNFDKITLTGVGFCNANNLVYSQFLYWKKQLIINLRKLMTKNSHGLT